MMDQPQGVLADGARVSRGLALLVGAAIAAPCVAVSLTALHLPATLVYVATALLVAVGVAVANVKAPAALASVANGGRLLFAFWLVLSAVAVYRIASLALFIDDPSRSQHAIRIHTRQLDDPELTKPFYPTHNCSTCYLVAVHLAGEGAEDIYDRKHYRDPDVKTPIHETIGETFHIDQYQYPPPFLLGPYLAYVTGLDFFQLRSLWFAFSVLLFVLTSGAVTVWVGGWRFCALWLIWPAVLVSPTMIATLQTGNAHIFMVLIALLSMLLFERGWNGCGGVLLAYATLSKFFPGLLLVYLLLGRRWKALGWTVAAGAGLCVATFLAFGAAPYRAFLDRQLPAIVSGEAFWFAFESPHAMLANDSVMGLLYKLKGMGLTADWDPASGAKVLSWVYTLLAVGIAAAVGRRHAATACKQPEESNGQQARLTTVRAWVALIVLAQLRSPFLPSGYGHVPILLMLALLLTVEQTTITRLVVIAAGMGIFAVLLPLPIGPPTAAFDFGFSLFATVLALVLAMIVAMRRPTPAAITGAINLRIDQPV